MLDLDKYQLKTPYPQKPKTPVLRKKHTSQEAIKYAKELEVYEVLMQGYKEEMVERRRKQHDLENKFRDDLLEEYGFSKKDPVGLLIFNRAWEQGRSSGLHGVMSHFDEVNDFVERILETSDDVKNFVDNIPEASA